MYNLREEEAEMKRKFTLVAVKLIDVKEMASRENVIRFANRFEYIPLDMQKVKRKRKKAKKTIATELDKPDVTKIEKQAKSDKIKKKRPSQKKRTVMKKIKLGLLEDFNIKVKSKVWKDWVNK